MERAAVYRRALAPVMGLVGITGIAAAVFGAVRDFDSSSRPFAAYWAAIAMLCLVESFLLIRRQAIRQLEPFWSPPTRRIALAVSPAFFTGLVMGFLFFVANPSRWDYVMMLVLIWMVLYGMAMHAAGSFMPRGFRFFGWAYVVAGLGGLAWFVINPVPGTPVSDTPVPTPFPWGSANVAMGALFGGGHAAYGLYLRFTEKSAKVV